MIHLAKISSSGFGICLIFRWLALKPVTPMLYHWQDSESLQYPPQYVRPPALASNPISSI